MPRRPLSAAKVAALARLHATRPHPAWPAAVVARVRELNAAGLTDAAIARALPDVFRAPWQVTNLRRRLAPANRPAVRAAKRAGGAACRAVLAARHGTPHVGVLRVRAHRRYAADSGWPEDLPVRATMILNALARLGPLDGPQLAHAVGLPWKGVHTFSRRKTTLLAILKRRGLIVAAPGLAARRHAKGPGPELYFLSPLAESLIEERLSHVRESEALG